MRRAVSYRNRVLMVGQECEPRIVRIKAPGSVGGTGELGTAELGEGRSGEWVVGGRSRVSCGAYVVSCFSKHEKFVG